MMDHFCDCHPVSLALHRPRLENHITEQVTRHLNASYVFIDPRVHQQTLQGNNRW